MIFSDGTEVLLSEDRQAITFVGEGGRREVQPRRNMEHRYVRLEEARGVGGWVGGRDGSCLLLPRLGWCWWGRWPGVGVIDRATTEIPRSLPRPLLLLTLVAAPRTTTPHFCGRLSRALFEKIRVLLASGNENDGLFCVAREHVNRLRCLVGKLLTTLGWWVLGRKHEKHMHAQNTGRRSHFARPHHTDYHTVSSNYVHRRTPP